MSLDDTHEALIRFRHALVRFDESLRAGRLQIRDKHAVIDALWTDALRRQHDLAIETLDRQLAHYADTRGAEFEGFLDAKIAQLRFYLHGE